MRHRDFVQALAAASLRRIAAGEDPHDVLRKVARYLERTQRKRLLRLVARAVLAQCAREVRSHEFVLQLAREGDRTEAHAAVRSLMEQWGAAEAPLCEGIDPTLIRGWRAVWKGRMVDASVRRTIFALYAALRARNIN